MALCYGPVMVPLPYMATTPPKKPIRRKSDEERRDVLTKVLSTQEERDAFQVAADAAGMSLSTWLRYVAIKASKSAD